MKRSSALLLACLSLWFWPVPGTHAVRAQAGSNGTVFVYLQPQPTGGTPVDFSIDAVATVGNQPPARSLGVALKTVRWPESGRQRLLATGLVPDGSYSGLSLRLGRARVKSDRGEADLLVPDRPVSIDVPFVLARGGAVVIWVEMRVDDAPNRVTFEPAFTAYVAPRPIASLAGFVSVPSASAIVAFEKKRRLAATVIPIGGQPAGMALDQRSARLYVIHERSPYLTVIDAAQLTIVARARVRLRAAAIKVDTRRGLLYLGGPDEDAVEFYDPNTLLPINSIRTGGGVSHLAIDGEENALYIVSPDTGSLMVGGLADRKAGSEIDVGGAPYWVAVMGER